jgi:hypothetical protein
VPGHVLLARQEDGQVGLEGDHALQVRVEQAAQPRQALHLRGPRGVLAHPHHPVAQAELEDDLGQVGRQGDDARRALALRRGRRSAVAVTAAARSQEERGGDDGEERRAERADERPQ